MDGVFCRILLVLEIFFSLFLAYGVWEYIK